MHTEGRPVKGSEEAKGGGLRRNQPADTATPDLQPPDLGGNVFLLFKLPVCDTL